MAKVVLVHGGWCGKWCWDYNTKAIEAAGNEVICLDLPGHGENNPEAIVDVHLKDHVAYVEEQIQKIDGPVVLAAHSMTGMVISQVAEDMPEKVEKLVYIAAFMPNADGQRMVEFLQADEWTGISYKSSISLPNRTVVLNPLYARNLGFRFCDDEKFMFGLQHMQSENPAMWAEPVHLSDKYHSVPKYYIHTLKDNCLSYYMQRKMVHEEPVIKQYYLDTDHCCMLSEVDEFNNAIIDIVNDQYLPRALAMIEQFKATISQ